MANIEKSKNHRYFARFKTNNEFFNASLIYIIANGIGQGTTLLSNVFFTRYMSKTEYGLYSNYYSYVAILGPFVGLNLYYGLINAHTDYRSKFHEVRSSLLLLSFIGCVGAFFVGCALNFILGTPIAISNIILAVVHAYGFFLINFYMHSMNMENKYISKGIALAVPSVLQALIAGIAVVISNNYISRAVGATASIFLCGFILSIKIIKDSKPSINRIYWMYALRISLPAIIGSVSSMIMQQSDKAMLTALVGADSTAVYALVFNIGYILLAVQQATNGAWIAWIYKSLDYKRTDKVITVQKWYLVFMVIIVTLLYLTAPDIIRLLSPKEYWCFELVIPFVWGSFLMCINSMLGSVIQYNKRTDFISGITAFAAITNIILNFSFIKKWGMIGAAFSSVLAYIIIYIISSFYLHNKNAYIFKTVYYVKSAIAVAIIGICFYFVKNLSLIRYVVFGTILLAEGLFCFLKKGEIKSLFGGRLFANL